MYRCRNNVPSWLQRAALAAMPLLAGCTPRQPPYVVLFESYFPGWIVCALLGCIGSLVIRVVLIRLGIDEWMPMRTLVYMTLALGLTFLASLLIFVR